MIMAESSWLKLAFSDVVGRTYLYEGYDPVE